MRRNILLAGAGLLLVVGVLVFGVRAFLSGDDEPSIDDLVKTAESASDSAERERAAVALGNRGPEALPHLRRLAEQSDSDQVRAATLHGLGMQWDFDSMELLLSSMEDDSPVVRSRAAGAVARLLSRDRRFEAYGAQADRDRIIGFYRSDWEQLQGAPYFERYQREVKK